MSKKFKIAENHLKNLFQKFKNILLPKNLSEIYNYANSFEDIGPITRSYEVKIIANENNERLEHKHIIFFIDYHFKRLFSSNHILIDCTFIFPIGYAQTMIIMYYDTILYRFIPGLFVLINNKTGNGYQHIFIDIIEIIQSYEKEVKSLLNWVSIATDFEKGLIKSIELEIINKYDNIIHYGCFFHYIKNIRKKLINLGFGTDANKGIYNEVIEFCYELPFA